MWKRLQKTPSDIKSSFGLYLCKPESNESVGTYVLY
jgi:hypothetical protein